METKDWDAKRAPFWAAKALPIFMPELSTEQKRLNPNSRFKTVPLVSFVLAALKIQS